MEVVSKTLNDVKKNYLILIIDIVLIIVLAVSTPSFMTFSNFDSLQTSIAPIAIISIGMMLLLISGNFDLSVGSNMNLSAFVVTMLIGNGQSMIVALAVGILVGGLVGVVNGILVAYAKVNPLITTIGMMYIVKGIADVLNADKGLYSSVVDFPKSFVNLGVGQVFGIYGTFIFMLILGIGVTIFLKKTSTGRNFYYLGGNPEAARQMGIDTRKLILGAYIFTGLLAGTAGILATARLQMATRFLGEVTHMTVLISCIIGGGSMLGGKGRIFGAILGAVFSSLLTNTFNLFEIDTLWQKVVLGGVLVGVVFIDGFIVLTEQKRLGKL